MSTPSELRPANVLISEVGPRDGLQSVKATMATHAKLAWIDALYASGIREIEVASFVPAKLLPQMADAAEVVRHALTLPGLTVMALVHHAFAAMDISRIESACLPENVASRGVLEKSGFKYEGVAQSYLQINGRWRNHVLYANLRHDRRGRTDVG